MASIGKHIGFWTFRTVLGIFYIMPFWLMYGISDLLFLLLYYVLGYRKKVVRDNLRQCFPDWTAAELLRVERRFYRHLSDIFMEGIKGLTLSDKETIRRYKIMTPDAPNIPFREGRASLFVGSHYNNWEYGGLGCGLQVEPLVIIFFKPVKNELINNYIRQKRALKNSVFAPVNETAHYFEDYFPRHPMYIMLADQSPSNIPESHWVKFLNRDTPVLHGPAKYAHKYGLPIYMIRTIKVKRGFYEVSAHLIIEDSLALSQAEISTIFMRELEELIRPAPEYWLWSHKRWKHQRK